MDEVPQTAAEWFARDGHLKDIVFADEEERGDDEPEYCDCADYDHDAYMRTDCELVCRHCLRVVNWRG